MAGRGGFVAGGALVAATLGALWMYPHMEFARGPVPFLLYVGALAVLAVPLVWAESAWGHRRSRPLPAAFGPGRHWMGWTGAVIATALAAVVAVPTGWAVRWGITGFKDPIASDPESHQAALSMGPDALLAAVLVLAVAAIIVALRRTELLAKVAVPGALTLLAIAAIYVQTLDGAADGRDTLVSGWTFDGAMVTTAFIQAALTVAAGAGVWTLLGSARRDHRAIPADTLYSVAAAPLFVALIGLIVIPLLSSQGLFAMDDGRGDGGLFCLLPQALASLGGAAGGILAGLIYGALALLAIPAIALLLEVPTQAMEQRAGRTAATAAVALGALAIAAPFAVHGNWLPEVRLVAAALAAFASALLAIHLVTQRPDAQRLAAPKPQVRAVLALEILLAAAVLAAATYAALATSGTVDPPEGLARILP